MFSSIGYMLHQFSSVQFSSVAAAAAAAAAAVQLYQFWCSSSSITARCSIILKEKSTFLPFHILFLYSDSHIQTHTYLHTYIHTHTPPIPFLFSSSKEPIMKHTIKQQQKQQLHDSDSDSDVGVVSMIISLEGHLFDSGLINQVLDVLEINQCSFEFLECNVQCLVKSSAILKISITNHNSDAESNSTMLEDVQTKIIALVDAIPTADATLDRLDDERSSMNGMVNKNKAIIGKSSGGSGYNITTASSSNGAVYVEDNGSDNNNKTVLLLGSGRVSKSVVSLLTGGGDNTSTINNRKYNIIVASNDEDEARDVIESSVSSSVSSSSLSSGARGRGRRGRYEKVDIMNGHGSGRLQDLIVNESDIVISLLPASMHTSIAELCIDAKVNLVTASYVSNEMQQLHDKAKYAGIKILNEIGLDPGLGNSFSPSFSRVPFCLFTQSYCTVYYFTVYFYSPPPPIFFFFTDHCSAMQIIDNIRDRGGKITTFKSVCGGLPSPEAALDNPLQYKFSWSPRGVISASQNDAKYLLNGKLVQVLGKDLLANSTPFEDKCWSNDIELECLPNRDSLHYQTTYGLEDANTLFRGTLRYRGFSSLMHVFQNMGFFDDSIILNGSTSSSSIVSTWDDVLKVLMDNRQDSSNNNGNGNGTRTRRTIDEFILASANGNVEESIRAKECLQWLGIMMSGGQADEEDISSRINISNNNNNNTTIVDLFCQRLEERLEYGKSERDMVVMHHTIGAEFESEIENENEKDGTTNMIYEEHHSSLQAFGTEDTMTAMCKTVGYPAAVAADLILCGNLDHRCGGVLLPTTKDMYEPILEAVKKEGIVFDEHVVKTPIKHKQK
jgi:alpha-aminoadipic semialdehyde synthase